MCNLYLSRGGITAQGIPYPYGCMAGQPADRINTEEKEEEYFVWAQFSSVGCTVVMQIIVRVQSICRSIYRRYWCTDLCPKASGECNIIAVSHMSVRSWQIVVFLCGSRYESFIRWLELLPFSPPVLGQLFFYSECLSIQRVLSKIYSGSPFWISALPFWVF